MRVFDQDAPISCTASTLSYNSLQNLVLKHSSATQNGAAVLFTFNRTVHQDSYVSINCTNNSYPNSATGTNVTYNVSATNHGQGEVQHVAYVPTEAKLRIEELSLLFREYDLEPIRVQYVFKICITHDFPLAETDALIVNLNVSLVDGVDCTARKSSVNCSDGSDESLGTTSLSSDNSVLTYNFTASSSHGNFVKLKCSNSPKVSNIPDSSHASIKVQTVDKYGDAINSNSSAAVFISKT